VRLARQYKYTHCPELLYDAKDNALKVAENSGCLMHYFNHTGSRHNNLKYSNKVK